MTEEAAAEATTGIEGEEAAEDAEEAEGVVEEGEAVTEADGTETAMPSGGTTSASERERTMVNRLLLKRRRPRLRHPESSQAGRSRRRQRQTSRLTSPLA